MDTPVGEGTRKLSAGAPGKGVVLGLIGQLFLVFLTAASWLPGTVTLILGGPICMVVTVLIRRYAVRRAAPGNRRRVEILMSLIPAGNLLLIVYLLVVDGFL